jgi:hypothetical protein
MIYLASPYSHPDPVVREKRFRMACRITARLVHAGRVVLSPVVHGHPLVGFGLPTDWSFWQRIDRAYLARCDEVMVLVQDGWELSAGVRSELVYARELGKPVRYLGVGDDPASPTLAHGGPGGGG